MPTLSPPMTRSARLRDSSSVRWSGFTKPSSRHAAAFEVAIDEISVASHRLLESIAGNLAGAGHRS